MRQFELEWNRNMQSIQIYIDTLISLGVQTTVRTKNDPMENYNSGENRSTKKMPRKKHRNEDAFLKLDCEVLPIYHFLVPFALTRTFEHVNNMQWSGEHITCPIDVIFYLPLHLPMPHSNQMQSKISQITNRFV